MQQNNIILSSWIGLAGALSMGFCLNFFTPAIIEENSKIGWTWLLFSSLLCLVALAIRLAPEIGKTAKKSN